ncbi:MAG: methionine ABC transporter permease [Oscillospiraceae bacterium]
MQDFLINYGPLVLQGLKDTAYMVLFSSFFAYVLGLPMGIALYTTKPGGLLEHKGFYGVLKFYSILGWGINIFRSIPFIILFVTLMPFTRLIAGKAIGPSAAIVSLTIGACPFVARLVESTLEEIDKGVIEACQCMGASPWQIITKVLISESLPSIIRGLSMTIITLMGYSAIAGAVGAGGLGDIAIRYGLHRGQTSVMYLTVVIIILIVSIIQGSLDHLAKITDKRNA